MKGISVLGYSVKQGIKSLKKNRMFTLASIGTITACLFLFGLFYFVLSNFQFMLQKTESSVGITVFFEEGISHEQIMAIGQSIRSRQEVERVEFISAEEAWARFQKENFADSPELIASFNGDNPLADSASYEIYVKEIEQQATLVEYLKTVIGIRDIKKSDEVASGMITANHLVSVVSGVLILVLILVSIFLIHSTISTGITVRKPEISIMRLLGASDYYIWSPFIVEGIMIGFIGSLIPLVILAISYGRIVAYLSSHFSVFAGGISFLPTKEIFIVLIPVSVAIGVGIGFLGSFITVRRNLNV